MFVILGWVLCGVIGYWVIPKEIKSSYDKEVPAFTLLYIVFGPMTLIAALIARISYN